jgi:hypothetical protein
MESTRHFKPPWTLIRENSECYVVRDANGVTVAWLFCRDDSQRYSVGASKLTSEEARRIGKAISRIPEFMMQRQGFYPRRRAALAGRSTLSCRPGGHLHSRPLERNLRNLQGQQSALQFDRRNHPERRGVESL